MAKSSRVRGTGLLLWATYRHNTSHTLLWAEARELPASHTEDDTFPGWVGLVLGMHLGLTEGGKFSLNTEWQMTGKGYRQEWPGKQNKACYDRCGGARNKQREAKTGWQSPCNSQGKWIFFSTRLDTGRTKNAVLIMLWNKERLNGIYGKTDG